jgi:hypothetical protein
MPESIANLDLGYISRKLLDDDAFEAERRNGETLWNEARAQRALLEYKQFLSLMYWYPDAAIVPSEDIDEVWHTHVLHTANYYNDCMTIFGCFQDHVPTSDSSDDEQHANTNNGDETQKLFEEAFGEVPQSYTATENFKCRRTLANARCRRTANAKCRRMTTAARCRRVPVAARCRRETAS